MGKKIIIIPIVFLIAVLGIRTYNKIKQQKEFQNTKIIVTSIIHDKELVLNTGADLYLPKPYEIPNLIKWVDSFVKEFNNY